MQTYHFSLQSKPLTMYTINRNPSITYNPTTSKYTVNFAGKAIETTVTDKAATANEWVLEILSMYANKPTVVGLDIEWRPHQISYLSNKSATLQLCIENKCLILQLFYMDEIPEKLKAFLSDPNFTYVGIEVVFFLISDFIFFLNFIIIIIIIISHW